MIIKILKKLIYKERADSRSFCNWLREKGVAVGCNTEFVSPTNTTIDMTRPFLIEIRSDYTISDHVTILSHDYSWSIVAKKYSKEIYPLLGKVKIGDNCFLGSHCIILCNASIGNNCIIGAGSVVTKSLPDNVVIAGVPAKVICTLDEYKEKIKKRGYDNYLLLKQVYKEKTGKDPDESILQEHLTYFLSNEEIKKRAKNSMINLI